MNHIEVPFSVKGESKETGRAGVEPIYDLPITRESYDVAAPRVSHVDQSIMERDPRGRDEQTL